MMYADLCSLPKDERSIYIHKYVKRQMACDLYIHKYVKRQMACDLYIHKYVKRQMACDLQVSKESLRFCYECMKWNLED